MTRPGRDPDRVHCEHYSPGMMTAPRGKMLCRALINPVTAYNNGETSGWVKVAPCFGRSGAAICPKAEYPTPEQVAEREAAMERRMKQVVSAIAIIRPAVITHHKATGESSGKMDCPECKRAGGVHWSRSNYNGHIHAQCETDDCIGWME